MSIIDKINNTNSMMINNITITQRHRIDMVKMEMEQVKTEMCDDYCKYPQILNQETLDLQCTHCPLNKLC